MIQAQPLPRQHAPAWQHELRHAFSRPADLLDFLGIDPSLSEVRLSHVQDFPLRVPRGFAARMRKGDLRDPLFLQVWPRAAEDDEAPGFTLDAVGDLPKARGGGVIHKYHGRALLIATGACAIHCRYCFRRHFPYSDQLAARDHWSAALETIASDPSIEEVILSGGDPLSLSDEKLSVLAAGLEKIPHVERLRIHTRQPVVLPERVDDGLLSWLGKGRLQALVVLHANHAGELDGSVGSALLRMRDAGLPLLNQSVLLRGVNDSVDALRNLSKRLFAFGVLPYYLHRLDRVAGAAHFEVDDEAAARLMRGLAANLPGYLVPKLVREEPGAEAKTWIAW